METRPKRGLGSVRQNGSCFWVVQIYKTETRNGVYVEAFITVSALTNGPEILVPGFLK